MHLREEMADPAKIMIIFHFVVELDKKMVSFTGIYIVSISVIIVTDIMHFLVDVTKAWLVSIWMGAVWRNFLVIFQK